MPVERFEAGVQVLLDEQLDPQAIYPLATHLSSADVPTRTDTRESSGPYMSLEWYLPTAAIIYLAKPYFQGLLQEAGKDHYVAIRGGHQETLVVVLWITATGTYASRLVQPRKTRPELCILARDLRSG
jgi:hypothetical protein